MNNIESILEKYFEGKTSLKEEELLRQYFLQDDIPEHLRIYKPVFNFFSEEREIMESGKLKVEKGKTGKEKSHKVMFWSICAGVAASLLLFFSIKSLLVQEQQVQGESIVYIGGVKYTGSDIVNSEALNALENFSDMDDDVMNSQIDILDSFNDL